MYSLDFLKGFSKEGENVTFEYRLLSSGELYNSEVITSDWRKSDATRFLLREPFLLFVCSHPFDDYPQETSLQFNAPLVTEQKDRRTLSFYPDDDISYDIAALLSLYCRRLITVAGKIREQHPPQHDPNDSRLVDWPVDLINTLSIKAWRRKPATVIFGREGISELIDYNPPPFGIVPSKLKQFLEVIPYLPNAKNFILSVRLYALALYYLEEDVNRTYQLLISSIETLSNSVMEGFEPNDDEKVNVKLSVYKLALKYGLSKEQAQSLAIEACKGMPWAKRKFKDFIIKYSDDTIFTEDELFNVPAIYIPDPSKFGEVIDLIYNARSSLTHHGISYPSSSKLGIGPTIPSRVAMQLFSTEEIFPPVVWFEHVVNLVLREYVLRSTKNREDA